MKIYYVTGNKGKVKLAKMIFEGMDVEIIQEDIDTPEIQSLDCEEVSKYSCKYAADKLGKAVMKNDSGFCIEALNGFPGALAKYAEESIGAQGFVDLVKGKSNKCYWVEVLSYCEPGGEPVSFTSLTYGTISDTVREGRGWPYDKIFIPLNDTRAFSEMSEEEQLRCFDNKAYLDLLEYIKKK